jgi:hypothetical protein
MEFTRWIRCAFEPAIRRRSQNLGLSRAAPADRRNKDLAALEGIPLGPQLLLSLYRTDLAYASMNTPRFFAL